QSMLLRLVTDSGRTQSYTLRDIMDRYLEELSSLDAVDDSRAPVPTGFTDLDAALGRMHRGDLVILAGRPAHGKSALAMNIAWNACRQGHRVVYFSLEMGADQLGMRLLASVADVDHQMLRVGLLGEAAIDRIMAAAGE